MVPVLFQAFFTRARSFIPALLLLTVVHANADWIVASTSDKMTDQVVRYAVSIDNAGNGFSIYRQKNGSVWGMLALSPKSADLLSQETQPMYRVDKNKAVDLSEIKQLQEISPSIKSYSWGPKRVIFLLWHGQDEQGLGTRISELMQGQTLLVRYNTSTGETRETNFPMKNAQQAISSILGLHAPAGTN